MGLDEIHSLLSHLSSAHEQRVKKDQWHPIPTSIHSGQSINDVNDGVVIDTCFLFLLSVLLYSDCSETESTCQREFRPLLPKGHHKLFISLLLCVTAVSKAMYVRESISW